MLVKHLILIKVYEKNVKIAIKVSDEKIKVYIDCGKIILLYFSKIA